jgi:hypothetical protein
MRARDLLAIACFVAPVAACQWEHAFDRDAPAVKEAIRDLDAGDAGAAARTLEEYLSTGACKEGSIGLPATVRRLPNGAFDLGLALFDIGERFGQRFGEEEVDAGDDEAHQRRAAQIACALTIVQNVASDLSVPLDLRARARYLEGNLDFLGGDYEAAVRAYDEAIGMAPGMLDAGDPVGRDAAWNRAIALRRIEDKKDAGNDAEPPDASRDGSQPQDSGPRDSGQGDTGPQDSGGNNGQQDAQQPQPQDAGGQDSGGDAGAPPPPEDAGPPPPPKASPDERVLDKLENAPTLQEEEAKNRARARARVRGAEDK